MSRLYTQICLSMLAVVVAAVLVGGGLIHRATRDPLQALRRGLLLQTARLIVNDVREVADRPGSRIQEILEDSYGAFPRLRICLVEGEEGPLEVHGDCPVDGASLQRLARIPLGSDPPHHLEPAPEGPGFRLVLGVGEGPEEGGKVPRRILLFGEGPGEEITRAFRRGSVQAAMAVILITGILGGLVFRSLTRRLGVLQRAQLAVAEGLRHFDLPLEGNDEITELSRSFLEMVARLDAAETSSREAEQIRSSMLCDISHELKTPLTSLQGQLERIGERSEDEGVALAREEVERLRRLIEDFLEVHRLQTPRVRLDLEELVVQRIVRRARDRMELPAGNREVRLVTEFCPEPVSLLLDGRRIEQVLVNLIENALRHAPRGTDVVLSVEPIGEGGRVAVTDQGPGPGPGDPERLFQRFRTGGADSGGTGLGLSIVRQIVELHGGRVLLEPGQPCGTRAIVMIPPAAAVSGTGC